MGTNFLGEKRKLLGANSAFTRRESYPGETKVPGEKEKLLEILLPRGEEKAPKGETC
jgi:hypothetical protein